MLIIKGNAKWAKVHVPDTKFNPDGDYSIQALMSAEEAAVVEEKLQEILDEFVAELVKEKPQLAKTLKLADLCETEFDQDGVETGNIIFKAKRKAIIHSKKTGKDYVQNVVVVDAKLQPTKVDIGNGSVVKIAVEPRPYYMPSTKTAGVSLQLNAVQVITLVEYKGSASAVFDEEEGYETEATNNTPFDVNEDF
jgi:hypothetical protein